MNNKTTIIDVRTPAEFMGGNVQGSINIPLQEVSARLEEIKAMPQPIILCCASGMRSEQATMFLRQHGVDCSNGGGWMEVNGNF
jgi:phage shock protein E